MDPLTVAAASDQPTAAAAVQILTSRKRKAWEGIHAGGHKWVGGQRPPALR